MRPIGHLAMRAIWQDIPVVLGATGIPVVPMKRVCEALGIAWDRQWDKTVTEHLRRRAGIELVSVHDGVQERRMICMRADRVAAYINEINPRRLRAGGNDTAASLVEKLQDEWDAILASQLGAELRVFKF